MAAGRQSKRQISWKARCNLVPLLLRQCCVTCVGSCRLAVLVFVLIERVLTVHGQAGRPLRVDYHIMSELTFCMIALCCN